MTNYSDWCQEAIDRCESVIAVAKAWRRWLEAYCPEALGAPMEHDNVVFTRSCVYVSLSNKGNLKRLGILSGIMEFLETDNLSIGYGQYMDREPWEGQAITITRKVECKHEYEVVERKKYTMCGPKPPSGPEIVSVREVS